MLSVIVPSYKDPYLHKTIDSILENATGEIEIIAVLDGYWTEVKQDPRVRVLHLGQNVGMREAINSGVRIARGEYIMRTDEHCMFAKGFDTAMLSVIQPNWIMTATRYFLDPVKWEVIEDLKPFVYEKLVLRNDGLKFEGQRWHSREKARKDIDVDETMAMQGSFWIMPKAWWEKVIIELQTEGYGRHYQDSHEMVFKTWQAGGKLMVHKGTWYAHKHVSFPRTHNEASKAKDSWDYSIKVWKDYYLNEVKPKWLLETAQ